MSTSPTSPTPKPPSVFRRLQEPAALNYLVMTGAGLLVYGIDRKSVV